MRIARHPYVDGAWRLDLVQPRLILLAIDDVSERKQREEVMREEHAAARPRRILVADDNVDAAESMAMLLELAGHDVRVVHDGLAAVKVAEAFQPEIVLLDIGMPTLNGYEAARRIRKLDPAVRLLALSGYAQQEDRIQSQEAGFDLHLVKPVDTRVLRDFIAGPQSSQAGPGAR